MTGWIIYSIEDVEKNKNYIQMYKDKFAVHGIKIKTIILEEVSNLEETIKRKRPAFAVNRSRNADVAETLEKAGIRVFNSSKVTKIANNKGKSYEFFQDTVPFLPVKYGEKIIVSQMENQDFHYPYVIKSCTGHGGNEVFMVENNQQEAAAIAAIQAREKKVSEASAAIQAKKTSATEQKYRRGKSNYVIQQCCSDLGKDVRVYVIGNEIVAAVLRTSGSSFKSNYSLGGKAALYQLSDRERQMVNAITKKLSIDYAGIDFIFHHGEAVFNEIEDAVGARMLYQVSEMDIVQKYVDYIVKELKSIL